MVFSFRARRTLFEGLTYLIDQYRRDSAGSSGQTLTTYRFERTKVNRIAIVVGIAIPALVFAGLTAFNGILDKVDSSQPKKFTKAGLTISLTQDFTEQDEVSYTAVYGTTRYLVLTLKEDFASLSDAGIASDTSLKDYATSIVENNGLDSPIVATGCGPASRMRRRRAGRTIPIS